MTPPNSNIYIFELMIVTFKIKTHRGQAATADVHGLFRKIIYNLIMTLIHTVRFGKEGVKIKIKLKNWYLC